MGTMRVVPLVCLAIGSLAACGPEVPTEEDLYGTWRNDGEDGQVREWRYAAADDGSHPELVGLSPVYLVYLYPIGAAPFEPPAQGGSYAIDSVAVDPEGDGASREDALITTVILGGPGMYADAILDYAGDTITLHSATSPTGERVYTRVTP